MNTATIAQSDQRDHLSPPPAAYSVADFCAAHNITKVLLYSMLKAGTGPRIMKVGRRTLISIEAAADWRRQMESGAQVLPDRRAGARRRTSPAAAFTTGNHRDLPRTADERRGGAGKSSGIRE